MEKLSSNKFTFTVVAMDNRKRRITLTRTADNKARVFELNGGQDVEALTNHMNSLTDTLCEDMLRK